jgi:hypothetical protein
LLDCAEAELIVAVTPGVADAKVNQPAGMNIDNYRAAAGNFPPSFIFS